MRALRRSTCDLRRTFRARVDSNAHQRLLFPVVLAYRAKKSSESLGFCSTAVSLVQLVTTRDDWLSKKTTSTTPRTTPPTTATTVVAAAGIATTTMAVSSDKASSASSGWSDEEGDEYLAKALASDEYLQGLSATAEGGTCATHSSSGVLALGCNGFFLTSCVVSMPVPKRDVLCSSVCRCTRPISQGSKSSCHWGEKTNANEGPCRALAQA